VDVSVNHKNYTTRNNITQQRTKNISDTKILTYIIRCAAARGSVYISFIHSVRNNTKMKKRIHSPSDLPKFLQSSTCASILSFVKEMCDSVRGKPFSDQNVLKDVLDVVKGKTRRYYSPTHSLTLSLSLTHTHTHTQLLRLVINSSRHFHHQNNLNGSETNRFEIGMPRYRKESCSRIRSFRNTSWHRSVILHALILVQGMNVILCCL
jgi:hypothetical protein